MNYIDILNNQKIIDIYNKIDKVNNEPFNHGMKHINNVCNIMNELCNILNIDKDMKDALLIASALHDIGQVEGSLEHGFRAVQYIKDNYNEELNNNKYYNDILNAVELHSNDSKEDDSLFTILLQAADKFDFTKNRLEDNYKDKYDYFFTEEILKLEFIYDETNFGINIITTDKPNFEELFFGLKFFHRVINIINVLSNKLDRKPIIKHNNKKIY